MKRILFLLGLCALPLPAEVAQQAYLKASNTDPVVNHPFVEVLLEIAQTYGDYSFLPDLGEWFGSSVAISGDTAVVGAPQEHSGSAGVNGDQSDDSLLSAGAAYVFIRIGTTWIQQAYLKASNPVEGASFGRSIAISGDTIVVGAPREDGASSGVNGDQSDQTAPSAGAAYVFVRSGTTWTQEAYLKASNTEAGDLFGSALAIDGDQLVVGAPGESGAFTGPSADQTDNSAEDAGAAYIFSRSGTTWTQLRYLKASNPEGDTPESSDGDLFGTSVAISGDTVVVGAPGEDSAATGVDGDQADNSASESGAAYVFKNIVGTIWALQAYLKASNTDGSSFIQQGDRFGTSVAIDGPLLAVGAPEENSSATGVDGDQSNNDAARTGAAYVFARSGIVWSQEAYLKASNAGGFDDFGIVLALSGTTLVVGAPGEDGIATGIDGDDSSNIGVNAGACYVFEKPATTWSQTHYLKPSYLKDTPPVEDDTTNIDLSSLSGLGGSSSTPDPDAIASLDNFGSAVAIDGTVLLGGSPYEDGGSMGVDGDETNSNAPNSGAAYLFDLDAQPPIPQADITVQYPVERDLVSQFSEVDFGLVGSGQSGSLKFAIANDGGADLTGITIKVIGTHATDFAPSISNVGTLAPGTSLGFDLLFTPTAGGQREATLCVNSNDLDENPFTIDLTGIAVGQASDQDGDGMSDLAEWDLRRMGFDWQKKQSGLVSYYFATAESAGLYTTSEIGALYAPDPILSHDPVTDRFTMTMDWKRSTQPGVFADFPATAPGVSVNPQGDIEFEFQSPDDAALFRVAVD